MTLGLERVGVALGASMSYSAIIWSELIGIFIFSEIPNAWAVVGTVMVLYSTVHSGIVQASSRQVPTPVSPQSPCSETAETVLLLKP